MRKYLILAFLIMLILSCARTGTKTPERPRKLVLMIGDGMGLTQVCAAWTANKGKLNIERCTHVGLQKTYSADSYTTDSGASGTAMATGVKTFNGSIAVDTAGKPVRTILELAEERGLSTGLISTSSITHATPASFIAHNPDRGRYEEIALDFTRTDVDVIIGGGTYHFSKREDGLDLIEDFKNRGYRFVSEISQIGEVATGKLLCLTDTVHPPPVLKGRKGMLSLASSQALKILDGNEKGFFLMAEGSQIDWGGHANNTEYLVSEVLDFDDAVGRVLDFAEKDGETLVIVTADHETGGMAITGGNPVTGEILAVYGSENHTPVMVPVYAMGPGAELFTGIYDNTGIFDRMKAALGL